MLLSLGLQSQSEEEYEGGFYLVFEDTQDELTMQVLDFIGEEDQELLVELIDELNAYLDIPVVIPIRFMDCGVSNAFYDPQKQEISMCYEMIVESFGMFASLELSEEELSLATGNLLFSIMYHEIGHALVDVLELPITGREEDAVDQFSVVLLHEFDELGSEAMIHFASFWGILAHYSETSVDQMAFYGEHSLSSQRYYDILCLAYGSDASNLSQLVGEGALPESRAVRCEAEFERISNAWEDILDPYVRD